MGRMETYLKARIIADACVIGFLVFYLFCQKWDDLYV